MIRLFTPAQKLSIIATIIFITSTYAVLPASAQISYLSSADVKAETRKSKREAARYEADYKESHLNLADHSFKKGQSGRKSVMVQEIPADYNHDQEINIIYQEPKKTRAQKKLLRKTKKSIK